MSCPPAPFLQAVHPNHMVIRVTVMMIDVWPSPSTKIASFPILQRSHCVFPLKLSQTLLPELPALCRQRLFRCQMTCTVFFIPLVKRWVYIASLNMFCLTSRKSRLFRLLLIATAVLLVDGLDMLPTMDTFFKDVIKEEVTHACHSVIGLWQDHHVSSVFYFSFVSCSVPWSLFVCVCESVLN